MEKFREQLKVQQEKAILAGAILRGKEKEFDDLSELWSLAKTAGAEVVYKFQQKLARIHPATFIGKGKAAQLGEMAKKYEANVVIFDNDLSPAQIRELEEVIGVKVVDRSELILDIFATRAQTHQAKLQVELAQLEYTYPRLTRMWGHLDTVAGAGGGTAAGAVGGIGTRGTGEKQLEIDRRLVNKRITELKRELAVIDKRKVREISARNQMMKICLVGYTNAGKSTLMNALTEAGVFVEDRLFATLDTRTKKWQLGGGLDVLLSDTVGFVKRLPHHLVASFKATLEEAVNADLLLHIADASSDDAVEQIKSVNEVLEQIGCKDKPVILVLNKIDQLKRPGQLEMMQTLYQGGLCVSAKNGLNLDILTKRVEDIYRGQNIKVKIQIKPTDGKIQSFLRASAIILSEKYSEDKVVITAQLGANQLDKLKSLKPDKLQIK